MDVLAAQPNALPIFTHAAKCVALERKTLNRKSVSEETAKSLKKELQCWIKLAGLASTFTSTSTALHRNNCYGQTILAYTVWMGL